MTRYVIRRVLWAGVLLVSVTVVTFVIFFLTPTDPAKLVAGKAARPIDIARARHFLGLDKPVPYQYAKFLGRLTGIRWNRQHNTVWNIEFKGPSLGQSFATRQDVNQIVGHAAPVTASLVFGGALVWMLIALPLGILSALRPRSLLDRIAMIFVLIGISAHPVWIGLIFSFVFGYKLGLTPITGYCNAINPVGSCGGPVQWAYHMILPWMHVRDPVRGAVRAHDPRERDRGAERGLRAHRARQGRARVAVMRSHVLRNALLPVVTMLGMDISLALGGAVFTESVYGLPGLGHTLVQSLDSVDLPVMIGIVVFATVCIILLNLFVDLIYAVVDPRIRLA